MNHIGTPPPPDQGPPAPDRHLLPCAERAEIQRQGAKAAARGEAADTNPLGGPCNGPSVTGESVERWSQRSAAWEQGHEAQTAARRQARPTTPPGDAGEHA
jgi:hypothetical protein